MNAALRERAISHLQAKVSRPPEEAWQDILANDPAQAMPFLASLRRQAKKRAKRGLGAL